MSDEWVEVELWSTDPNAVDAVRNTFKMMRGAGEESFKQEGERFFVRAGFPAFAAEHQGYVRRIVRFPAPSAEPAGEGEKG